MVGEVFPSLRQVGHLRCCAEKSVLGESRMLALPCLLRGKGGKSVAISPTMRQAKAIWQAVLSGPEACMVGDPGCSAGLLLTLLTFPLPLMATSKM